MWLGKANAKKEGKKIFNSAFFKIADSLTGNRACAAVCRSTLPKAVAPHEQTRGGR